MKRYPYLWFGIVGLGVLLPFHAVLLHAETSFLFRDLGNSLWSSLHYWCDTIRSEGRIALWNPLLMGGKPFLADASERALFPLNFVLLLFSAQDFARAIVWFLLSHYILLALGYFKLFRTVDLTEPICAALALVFSWSGYSLSSLTLYHMLAGQVGAIWCVAMWLRFLQSGSYFHCWLSSAWLAFAYYGGDPQFLFLVPPFLLLLAWRAQWSWFRLFTAFACQLLLTALLMAPAFLPQFAYTMQSSRREGLQSLAASQVWSLDPARLWELFFPLVFGTWDPEPQFGGLFREGGFGDIPFLICISFSAPILFLWLVNCVFAAKKSKSLVLLGWTLFFVLLSLGRLAPVDVYAPLYKYLPFWNSFRYPQRLWVGVQWGVALGVAESLLVAKKASLTRATYALLVALPFVAAFGLHLFLPSHLWQQQLWVSVVPSTVLWLTALFLWRSPTRLALSGVLALALVSTFLTAQELAIPQQSSWAELSANPLANAILADQKNRPEELLQGAARRFFARDEFKRVPQGRAQDLGETFSQKTLRVAFGQLGRNTSAFFNIENIFGYFSLLPEQRVLMWKSLANDQKKLLDILGVAHQSVQLADGKYAMERRADALPYVFLPRQIFAVSDASSAWLQLQKQSPVTAASAWVETDQANILAGASALKVARIERGSSFMRIRLDRAPLAQEKVFLVWNESFHKQWKLCPLNGARPSCITPLRVNGWAMGAWIESQDIEFRFEEPLFVWGLYLCLLGLMPSAIFAYLAIRRRLY